MFALKLLFLIKMCVYIHWLIIRSLRIYTRCYMYVIWSLRTRVIWKSNVTLELRVYVCIVEKTGVV